MALAGLELYVDQVVFSLRDLPVSVFCELGLKACSTVPGPVWLWKKECIWDWIALRTLLFEHSHISLLMYCYLNKFLGISLKVCLSSTKVCPFTYFMCSLRVSYNMFWSHTQPLPHLFPDPSPLIYQIYLVFFLTLSRPVCVAHYGCVVFHWRVVDLPGTILRENGLSSP